MQKKLLESNRNTITDTALAVGYSDLSYFGRIFSTTADFLVDKQNDIMYHSDR